MSRHQAAMDAETDSSIEQPSSFSSLPYELVCQILSLTYQPQVVIIDFKRHKRPRNKTPVPAALHINRMCRKVAKENYTLLEYNPRKGIDFETWPRIYMNFETDHIMLSFCPDYLRFIHGQLTWHLTNGLLIWEEYANIPIFRYTPAPSMALVRLASFIKPEHRKQLSIMYPDLNANHLRVEMLRSIPGVISGILLRSSREMVFVVRAGAMMRDCCIFKEVLKWCDERQDMRRCSREITKVRQQLEQELGFVGKWVESGRAEKRLLSSVAANFLTWGSAYSGL